MSQAQLIPIPDPILNFPAVTYKGTPVLTTGMLAHAYGVNAKQIRQNFNNNRERFTDGKHFFMLSGKELKEFKNCVEIIDPVAIPLRTKSLTLWTDRGSARHAKMLESDKAWDVYEMLEDTFFNVTKLAAEERALATENVKAIPQSTTPSTAEDRAPLRALVHAWASIAGVHHAALWPQVKAHFQLSRIDDLPLEWLPDALAFVQGKIDNIGQQQVAPAEIKTLPPAPSFIPEKGREVMERLLALRGTLYRVSAEMQEIMSAPFWDTPSRPCPDGFKPFAKAMNSATWAFVMSLNKELETAALLFEAFVEAEKVLRA